MIRLKLGTLFGSALLLLGLLAPSEAKAAFRIIITELEAPLVPNSVIDLADRLGYYKRAGVEIELIRVQQTPSAVAALRSGQGDMANIGFDTALQLIARDQMRLKGVISPDKALPFIIAAKKSITQPKQLEGKTFAVSRVGAVDYSLSRLVLAKLGVNTDRLDYLAVGQPPVRATSLVSGQVDATTVSIGIWTSIPDRSSLTMLIDQASFYKGAPLISKLNVVTEEVAKSKAKEVRAVVRGIILASRAFAADSKLWVDAMVKARPDMARPALEELAQAYSASWDVNGGLNLEEAKFTTETQYEGPDFKDLKRIEPNAWIDTAFVDSVLKEDGVAPGLDPTGR
jgi:NitT/TauT family transport system substrate-binding protein